MKVFVDSDAFIAIVRQDDANHLRAIECLNSLVKKSATFTTSGYVISEVVTVLSMRVSKAAAVQFIDTIQAPNSQYTILRIDEQTEREAIEVFKLQKSKNVSFVDCTNISLVRSKQLDSIFSFDKVYGKNGLSVVPVYRSKEEQEIMALSAYSVGYDYLSDPAEDIYTEDMGEKIE